MQQPITKKEIQNLQEQSNAVRLIDIRTPAEYEKMHVPGAVNMPSETIAQQMVKFNVNNIIVCICTKGQERSQDAADAIAAMGYPSVFYL